MTRSSIAAALVLGPVSGPLFLRAKTHWTNGDKFLAILYAVTIGLFWLLLPIIAAKIGVKA